MTFDVMRCETEAEWLAARRLGITGSEAPALWATEIANITEGEESYAWDSPYSLWCQKRGLIERQVDETEQMYWGKILEPHIADRFASDTGLALEDLGRTALLVNRERPHLRATLDRVIVAIDARGPGIVEIKSTEDFHLHAWNDGPPQRVWAQAQHQLAVTSWSWGFAVALIGKRGLISYPIARDEDWIAVHLQRVDDLWERIQSGDAPLTDGSQATSAAIAARFRRHQPEWKKLPDPDLVLRDAFPRDEDYEAARTHAIAEAERLRVMAGQLDTARKAKTEAERQAEEAKNALADFIGEAMGIEALVQWEFEKQGRVSWKDFAALLCPEPTEEQLAPHRGEPVKKLVKWRPPRKR